MYKLLYTANIIMKAFRGNWFGKVVIIRNDYNNLIPDSSPNYPLPSPPLSSQGRREAQDILEMKDHYQH